MMIALSGSLNDQVVDVSSVAEIDPCPDMIATYSPQDVEPKKRNKQIKKNQSNKKKSLR